MRNGLSLTRRGFIGFEGSRVEICIPLSKAPFEEEKKTLWSL